MLSSQLLTQRYKMHFFLRNEKKFLFFLKQEKDLLAFPFDKAVSMCVMKRGTVTPQNVVIAAKCNTNAKCNNNRRKM